MFRITPQHLAWALENLVEGRVVNRIQVRPDVKHWAKVALDRMLEVGKGRRQVSVVKCPVVAFSPAQSSWAAFFSSCSLSNA